jgi:hypothetical protein
MKEELGPTLQDLINGYFYQGYEYLAPGRREELNGRPRMPIDVCLRRNEEIRKMFPQAVPTPEERLASQVHEEFVL